MMVLLQLDDEGVMRHWQAADDGGDDAMKMMKDVLHCHSYCDCCLNNAPDPLILMGVH